MSQREPIKLKVIEALNEASLDESKYKGAIGFMIDEIINIAKFEIITEVREMIAKAVSEKEPPKTVVEHRNFGKQRVPGDPKRGGSL